MRDQDEEVVGLLGSEDGDERHGGVEGHGGVRDGDGDEAGSARGGIWEGIGNGTRDGDLKTTSKESNRFIWLLTLTACLSGLLFGYDTGIISSTLLSLNQSLGHTPTTTDLSLITSSTSLTALLASPTAGYLADLWGRRFVIAVSCVGFVFGAVIQATAVNVGWMVLGRAIVGLAVGGASGVVPLYISETTPPSRRGALVTVQSLAITLGQVLSYTLGWLLSPSWRLSILLGAIPALLQAFLLISLPESPRWLILASRDPEAGTVLRKLGHTESEIQHIISRVHSEAKPRDEGESNKFRELVTVPANRKALGVACGLQALQQLCGFNSLMYFSATIFASVGFTSPIGVSLSVAVTNFLFTGVAFRIIDRVGRRRILLLSIPFMVLGLGLVGTAFGAIGNGVGEESVGVGVRMARETGMAGIVWPGILVAATVLYVAAYATGLGCVPWQQAELFALSVRSVGSGLATATNWSSNFVVGATFLPMMERLGASVTFGIYAGVCILGWFWVWRFYPEVGGRGLEDGVADTSYEEAARED